MKLFDSELKIMEILWRDGDTTAKRIAETLAEETSWSKTTSYTVLRRCINKGAVSRKEPNFICRALVSKEKVQEALTFELINKMFGGKSDQLVASLLGSKELSKKDVKKLKDLIKDLP